MTREEVLKQLEGKEAETDLAQSQTYKLGETQLVPHESFIDAYNKKGAFLGRIFYKKLKNLEQWEKEINRSLGEKLVRVDFNAGNNGDVQNLKEQYARLIDYVRSLVPPIHEDIGEAKYLSKSIDLLEESAMFAVKGVTA